MDATTIILVITILILFFLSVFFIYRSVRLQSILIDPLNCPQTNAQFGVYPNTLGTSIVDTCGVNNDEICTFVQVTSLENAVEICNANANICSAFSYAPSNVPQADGTLNGTMSIINYTLGSTQSNIYDTYVQQIPITVL